jgi:G:T/U-mismatch repair DNA glycosylase
MKSDHPFEPFLPPGASKLIIGTIPPPRFCKVPNELYHDDVNFYYGSRDNYFWPLLEDICQTTFEYKNNEYAIEQRKKILESLNIGITDIINSCIHSDNSAKDEQLKEIIHKDLKSLLNNSPAIDTLIYTSEFVKRQINSYFKTFHSIGQNDPKQQVVKIEDKLYRVKILYSPSPSGLRNMGENGSEKRKNQYREFLLK